MNQPLTKANFWEKYQQAKTHTEKWSSRFSEFIRIARNEPPEGVPERYANIADGTTAGLIRRTPKRVIQQLPTGIVTSEDESDWLPIIAEFILHHRIIPYASGDYDLIQKFWTTIENGLILGGQAVYTPFVKNQGEFTTDASLVYWGDIFFQEGKKSLYSCDYFFIRSWLQPEDINQIIKSEGAASTWDIAALKKLKKTSKDDQALTASEQKAGVDGGGIEIITGFQKGVGAMFYTASSNGTIIREKRNKDPRGLPPVDYFYSDVDGSNPFGRGVVELVGGMQNMIDGDLRAYKFNRALGLAPPMLVWGNVDTSQALYESEAFFDMGDDPNSRIEPLSIDTTAIREYSNIYGLNKSQLLNLFNTGGDTSVGAEVGNPGFGRTPAAIKKQSEVMYADDNYTRKNFESFFENWAETAINVYFAEREGVEELQLDSKTANQLRKLGEPVDEDNKIKIDYSIPTPTLHFRVNASTSKMNGHTEQIESLQLLISMAQTPVLAQIIPKEVIIEAWNKIVANSGVEDPENLTIDPENQDPQDDEVADLLKRQGVPDEIIKEALALQAKGVPPEQIIQGIERLMHDRRPHL
jgi:hypothetical protein